MGVASPIRSLSSPGPSDPSDDDLDSGWDGEPVATAASSIPPATEAIDSEWASDDAEPAPVIAAAAIAAPAASATVKAPAASSGPLGSSPAKSAAEPVITPAGSRAEDGAPLSARPAAQASSSSTRATTPPPPRASLRPSGESGTRRAVRAKPLTDGHPPEVVPAQAKLPSNVRAQDEATAIEVLPEGSSPPAPPSSRAKALGASSAPEIAPPPVFASSPPAVTEFASSGASETFRPSQVDRPVSLPPARGRSRWLPALAAITVLALGGGAWLKLRPQPPQAQREARPTAVVARAALPEQAPAAPVAVEAAPAPAPDPAPAPAPTPEASAAAPAPSADLTSAFAAALAGKPTSANAVAVTVRVTPAGSIIFDHGRRIGTDVVQVNVEPGGRKNLVALLDGYLPRRFTVDSTLNSVSIALRPQGVPTPAEPATYGTPSTAAAPASPAAAPPAAAAAPPKAAAPKAPAAAKPGKKEAFDPSRDVGAL